MVNVAGLKSSDQVTLYNALTGSKIKKFENRSKAETRLSAAIKNAPVLALGKALELIGIKPEAPAPAKKEAEPAPALAPSAPAKKEAPAPALIFTHSAPKKEAAPAPVKKTPKPKEVHNHLNLRCATCGYYAKTTTIWLAKGRIVCPMGADHGKLLTPEEREEKRGVGKGKK